MTEATLQTAAVSAGPAKKERKLLYYRNPMGCPTPRRRRRKTPWEWTTSRSMRAKPTRGTRWTSGSRHEAAQDQHREGSEARRQNRGRQPALARPDRSRRRPHRAGRTPPVCDRAQVRGLRRAPARQCDRSAGRQGARCCSKSTARNWSLRNANTRSPSQGVESLNTAGSETRSSMQQLADASLTRLKNWDISDEQIKALASSGDSRRTLSFRSPVAGIVTEKKAVQGMRFMPGETLYQVADLSSVWVIADVFEQDIGLVRRCAGQGQDQRLSRTKSFRRHRHLRLSDAERRNAHGSGSRRTEPIRECCSNRRCSPRWNWRYRPPGAGAHRAGLRRDRQRHAPDRAGPAGEGRFEPREVKLGARSDTMSRSSKGVKEGEQVVVAANFLIDAESNLKAAVGGLSTPPTAPPAKAGAEPERRRPAQATRPKERSTAIDATQSRHGTIEHGPVDSLKWPAMTMVQGRQRNAAASG
jgi:hypothetical protein